MLSRLWRSLILEPWQRIDRENRDFLARPESRRPDWKVATVLLTAAVVLTLQEYPGQNPELLAGWLDRLGLTSLGDHLRAFVGPSTPRVNDLIYWALFSFATYFFIPSLVVVCLFRESIRNYGLKLRGAFTDWWLYVVFFAFMAGPLLVVSTNLHFQQTYPFYKVAAGEPLWPNFWRWEMCYGLQFIGLEFFFRGFMVHGTKHRFGFYAVFVMMVPYCMIHFRKPMPETFGAIGAGIVLGFMSLKTRSIWMGAAIHMSVALSMDFLSMWRQGMFP
jgi:membrane protease YdiL (CAAX protease family)